MPFAADGTYTPPTGAENAAPGQIIRSLTWNTIFTDMSAALTSLGARAPYLATPTTLGTASTYTLLTKDNVLLVQAAVGTIAMQASSLRPNTQVIIMGAAAGFFASHTVVVAAAGTDLISGASTLTLTSNWQAVTLYALPSGGYVITGKGP